MEGVSYGHKHKHIGTIERFIAPTIQQDARSVTATFIIRIEDYFAGRRQRRFGGLNEVDCPNVPKHSGSEQHQRRGSFNQTQDGYLQQVNTALSRMSELSIAAQDVTKTTADRALYNQEFTTLGAYVKDVSTKSFNGVSLFNGKSLAVTTDSSGATFTNKGVDLTSATYTQVYNSDAVDTVGNAQTALSDITKSINQLASDRANLGANEETLGYYGNQLTTLNNNLSAANSQIKDVDVAQESTNYAKYNILVQSGTAMLAQANSQPQSVLRLLS